MYTNTVRPETITSLDTSEEGSFLDSIKSNKLILGSLVFAIVVLIYFIGLNFLNPSDTEIIFEQDKVVSKPELKKQLAVHISGAIKDPGVYEVEEESRVVNVVSKAGGLISSADEAWVTKSLNLSSFVSDQQKIYIPFEWESANLLTNNTAQFPGKVESDSSKPASSVVVSSDKKVSTNIRLKLNVNGASKGALTELSGIGDVYAQRIIDNRPYSSPEDLEIKADLPRSTVDKIIEKITFD